MWGERGSLVQLDENRKREGEPMSATVWLNGGRKGGGENPCVLRFGSTGVGRGRGREPMRATVRLDEGRRGKGEGAYVCHSLARWGQEMGRGEPMHAVVNGLSPYPPPLTPHQAQE